MKLLQFFETEREHVVIESARCASQQSLEFDIATGGVAIVNGDYSPNVLPCLPLNAYHPPVDVDVQPASMSPPIQWLIAAGLAAAIQPKQNGSDERHERALSCFIAPVKNVQAGR